MANYNKSFNFRNGVQVDNDNFIVNTSGLVGIGTTTPAAYLDVYGISALRGNVTVSGVTSSTQSYVTGVSTFASDTFVGSGITMYASAGIVSATKFFGDASGMTGIFAVATGGWFVDASAGIAYTTSKIGIGTTNPIGSFTVNSGTSNQVARFQSSDLTATIDFVDPSTSSDVVIGCRGSDFILETGGSRSLTVESDGNVGIGSTLPKDLLDVKGTIISNGLNIAGVSTLGVTSITNLESQQLNVTGVGSISELKANGIGVTSLNVTGISTFTGITTFTSVGIADSIFHTGDTNTSITFPNADSIAANTSGSERIKINSIGDVNVSGTTTTANLHVSGVTTSKDTIHVFNDSTASIVAVGKSALGGYNGYFRYGQTTGGFRYSNSESLDIVSYSPGSFNFICDADVQQTDSSTGFQWLRGTNVVPSMTLTGIGGSLGIGITTPIHPLHVAGIATFSSNLNVGGQVKVNNNIVSNTGNLVLTTGDINAYVGTIKVDTVTAASIGATDISVSGGSTFTGDSDFSASVGIATDLVVDRNFKVGGISRFTGNSTFSNVNATGVSTAGAVHATSSFTVGTTAVQTGGAIQFGEAGVTTTRYMVLPKVTTTERNNLVGLSSGGLIYNTSTKKLNFYNGSSWEAVTSS